MERPVQFRAEHEIKDSLARAGEIVTPHGSIKTPAFMAVATKATVKGISPAQFAELGMQGVIANTYHLYLSPGEETVEHAGGVAAFMGWNGPTMTDSGGFQVLSLGGSGGKKIGDAVPGEVDEDTATEHGKLVAIDEDGVSFRSHIDGSSHRFTPERSMEIQHALGADIMFAFDECTASSADRAYQEQALARTHAWAKRSLAAHRTNAAKSAAQGLYGIVQGGRFEDLRVESARTLAGMDFDGYGIGGSFNKDDLLQVLEIVDRELPQDKPRHLLGIGEPEDIFIGVAAGIDTFDCVLPTRNGRNGTLYTPKGKVNITRKEYADDFSSVDSACDCPACTRFTRSFIHHLFRSGEMLAGILGTVHNIRFLTRLTEDIRRAIVEGNFAAFKNDFLSRYSNN